MGLIIHIDGGSRGNPGPSGAGVVIQAEDGQLIHEAGYFLGRQTNNAAEYHALLRALLRAGKCPRQPLAIYSDSELLVRQVTGEYDVKSPKLEQLYQQAQLLLLRAPRWTLRHLDREENQRADELVNLAIDREADVIVFDADPACGGHAAAVERPVENPSEAPVESRPVENRSHKELEARSVEDRPVGNRSHTVEAHAVQVRVERRPNVDICAAAACLPGEFRVDTTIPAGVCIHAAHSVLPTVLGMINTEPQEFATIPTLTVHCNRPGCGAIFHLSPVRSPNGRQHSRET